MKKKMYLMLMISLLPVLNFAIAASFAFAPGNNIVLAQEGIENAGKFIAMALSTGFAAIGAGYAVGHTGSAAIASITEKPEMFGRAIIIVGLAEGIAIYGLLISFLVWIS